MPKLRDQRFPWLKGQCAAQERSSRPPRSKPNQRIWSQIKEAAGDEARTSLSPTCPGSAGYFCCQPRVTGLVLQELPGLDIKVCAHRAHAMPLAAPQLTLSMTSPAQVRSGFSATTPITWTLSRSRFAPVSCFERLLLKFQPQDLECVCARSLIDRLAWPQSTKVEGLSVDSNRHKSLPVPAEQLEIAFVLAVASGLAFAFSFDRRSPQGLILRRFS